MQRFKSYHDKNENHKMVNTVKCRMLNAECLNCEWFNPDIKGSFYLFSRFFFRNGMCDVNDECIVFGIILYFIVEYIQSLAHQSMRYLNE